MSDFSELLRKIAVPQEDIDFFSSQPCAIPYLARRGNDAAATAPFQPIPFVTRHKYHKDDTSDTFFSRTINSNDTIPRMLALFRTKQSNEAEAEASTAANPDLIVFVQLGNGLNGFRDTLHGGALASLFDEVIGLCAEMGRLSLTTPTTATTTTTSEDGDGGGGAPPLLYTASLLVTYRSPISTPGVAYIKTWIEKRDGRKWFINGQFLDADGVVKAEAQALYITARKQASL